MLIRKSTLTGQQGFTLVEIIAVLIILGILAAVAVPRYIDLQENASNRAIDAAIAELNSRENLAWAKIKINGTDYALASAFNTDLWAEVAPGGEIDLGDDYTWGGTSSAPAQTGGELAFQSQTSVSLSRSLPTSAGGDPTKSPYVWARN